ncbi:MAG: 3-hexulose-6-phosphate synthase [Erysipelotrichaceae bacterium]|jgi:3-hexulose-6-phosphate synthase|nr:3-hexulose-6-phosphate synthase [Bacillota bacterium]NLP22472.1 3-hexulose-6-phosphate synthase [Erysipelotrichaceae bacterium]HCY06870.1 3-hexulose-6-phosphate synthase [Erysipelotrichaceae bacterium]
MKLQIALDTLTLKECIELLDETKDYIDIVEVGTPFIIEKGMKPVKKFSKRYKDLEILADTKIMDAGELEAEIAFKAGADIVTVLGVTHDETVQGALKAAKKYGGKIMIDMIGVNNIEERAKELEDMGVDYICVHTAFDIQSTGHNPLEELKRVNKVITKSKTAVAGGVKLETVDEIVSEGVDVVVVGGAISNASDRVLAAKQIKERLK